jgi:hypothetical protein
MALDINWVKAQLEGARVPIPVGVATLRLVEAWNECTGLEEHTAAQTSEIFAKLARGHAIYSPPPPPDFDNAEFFDAVPGFISVGDIVRVKPDAFSGDAGVIHNSRLGRVVAVRFGDIIVKSIDGIEPEIDGAHYSPHHLQKMLQR